ncbi:MAG: hypothetical protein ACKO40_14730 [Planctomycetaceae bacterium]
MTAGPDDAIEYRPVSPLAIAALVLGCCSAVALLTPFAWFLPLVALATALVALADVARPGAARVGRLPALAGLGLAVGFGAQAVTDAAVGRWIERSRAVATAETWLETVRAGRLEEARSVSAPSILPALTGLEPESDAAEAARFATLPAVRAAAAGPARIASAAPLGTADRAWVVRATIAGRETVRIIAVPRSAAKGRTVEKWTVTAAELET